MRGTGFFPLKISRSSETCCVWHSGYAVLAPAPPSVNHQLSPWSETLIRARAVEIFEMSKESKPLSLVVLDYAKS